jgi:hypothetical protein
MGQREDDVVMVTRQEPRPLPRQPALGLEIRALGTGAMPARVVPDTGDVAVFIHRQELAINEFVLEGLQVRVIQLEVQLERPIGQASTPLEHRYGLVQDLLKGHGHPSLCRCGVEKTV